MEKNIYMTLEGFRELLINIWLN